MKLLPDWADALPLQQQSVLILALRGPDGVAKDHPCKNVQRAYRASVIRAAYLGRMMRGDDKGDSFMSLARFNDSGTWEDDLTAFFTAVDSLPHHFYMHLMHGAQILGYRHPLAMVRGRWSFFYGMCCGDLHLSPETETGMDARLSDGLRLLWEPERV